MMIYNFIVLCICTLVAALPRAANNQAPGEIVDVASISPNTYSVALIDHNLVKRSAMVNCYYFSHITYDDFRLCERQALDKSKTGALCGVKADNILNPNNYYRNECQFPSVKVTLKKNNTNDKNVMVDCAQLAVTENAIWTACKEGGGYMEMYGDNRLMVHMADRWMD